MAAAMNEGDVLVKCVCVGDGAVGKTCLLIKYVDDKFLTTHIPTIFDNHSKLIDTGKEIINLSLWDTAGQEDYARLRPLSYANTNVFLICFSLESRASLKNVKQKWVPELLNYDKSHQSKQGKPKFILVGNKADLWEKMDKTSAEYITENEIQKLVKDESKYIKAFIKCSALSGKGVKKVFDTAVKIALEEPKESKSFCSIL